MLAEPCGIGLWDENESMAGMALVDFADWDWLGRFRWYRNAGGYAVGRMGGRDLVYMHRVIAGDKSSRKVDHINRNRLDNTRANLRLVDDKQHAQNQTKQAGRSSRYRGVCFNRRRGKWMAYASINGRRVYLGAAFATEDEADVAAAAWRRENMPYSEEARHA